MLFCCHTNYPKKVSDLNCSLFVSNGKPLPQMAKSCRCFYERLHYRVSGLKICTGFFHFRLKIDMWGDHTSERNDICYVHDASKLHRQNYGTRIIHAIYVPVYFLWHDLCLLKKSFLMDVDFTAY